MSAINDKLPELTDDNLRILVCCHKACSIPNDPHLVPVLGGSVNHESIPVGFYRDDQVNGLPCDNISNKNATYCELTSMYWAWKNLKTAFPAVEYIGLNHYRRYFDFSGKHKLELGYALPVEKIQDYSVDIESIKHLMSDADIIVANKLHYPYAIFQEYSIAHVSDDARRLVAIVHELHPEADDSMRRVFMRGNSLSLCNMFIMPFDLFSEYAEWLFGILAVAEQRIDLTGYSTRQARIFGFMAERLMNVWIDWKGLRSKTAPIVAYGDVNFLPPMIHVLNNARKDIAYHLSRQSESSANKMFDSFTNYWSV